MTGVQTCALPILHGGSIKPELEAQLRKAIGKRWEIFNFDQDAKSVQQEMESIDKDQGRLRENMKALKGSPEEKALLQRYTKQLDSQEDRLAALQKQAADLKAKRAQLQSEMDDLVAKITFDEKL